MKKSFSIADIKKLLQFCQKTNALLQYDGLVIDCRDSEKARQIPSPQARGSAKKAKEVEEKGKLQEQFDIANGIAESLHLEDPKAFEEMLIRGELAKEENH